MLIEEQFRALVLAVPAVAALVGTRFRPVALRTGDTLPAATYSRVRTEYEGETLNDERIEQPVLEVTLWGLDYTALKNAMLACKSALRVVESAPILSIGIVDEKDVFAEEFQHADGVGLPGVRLECQLFLES